MHILLFKPSARREGGREGGREGEEENVWL